MAKESVTGPPPSMREVSDDLTPMLSQYYELCEHYDDALVLFQVGDFYEAFCEAAEETARICEITLTEREDSTGEYPMAGIPIDNAAGYLERLLDAGYRVAVADQVEDAEATSGLVDRAVTQIITPGTVVEDELLAADSATYVASVAVSDPGEGGEGSGASETAGAADAAGADSADVADAVSDRRYAVAAIDVSTGDCLVTSVGTEQRLREELQRLEPAEFVRGPNADVAIDDLAVDPMETAWRPEAFEADPARDTVGAYVATPDAVLDADVEVRACGAVLAYAEYTQGGERLEYVSRITRYDPRESLRLDATALRSLELFETREEGRGRALIDVLDETSCAIGRRLLDRWLRRPLLDRAAVEARHDAVAELADEGVTRETIRDLLADVYDVERLIGRVSRGRANARDLRSLKATLDVVPEIAAELADAEAPRLRALEESMDGLADVRALIDRAIRPEPPMEITEGGVIREGFDDELDDLRSTEREGRQWVAELEAKERERTGIDSLEVGHNEVHGYYIEVTNPNLDRVPDDYQRRQTLKNAERFYTPELKRREDEILGAAERADALEYELFTEVRADVAAETDRVQALADALAELDVLASLAAVAVENDYVRPEFHGESGDAPIRIEGGRHPVVERTQREFVPNDAELGGERGDVAIVTGPNMSGKSTYMRQVALIVVLAQMGSFVPADAARLPIVDRVFTRVGASDDIAGGQSTFMREMAELTDILHSATEESLVLLDEVGRGTSTTDGLAIARATTEFLEREVGAYTLFATHYHELTALADEREGAFTLHFTATREDGTVTFLHRVEPGASSSSYGVEVAEMAGVPDPVVERSRALIAAEEGDRTGDADAGSAGDAPVQRTLTDPVRTGDSAVDSRVDGSDRSASDGPADADDAATDAAMSNGHAASATDEAAGPTGAGAEPADGNLAELATDLRELDIARMTPLEAMNALNELQEALEGE